MPDFQQPDELDHQITGLVEQHWRENHAPLLLSQLGSHGGGQVAHDVRAQGKGLKDYLRHRLADKVQVIEHTANPTITGVVPAGVASNADEGHDALLEKTRQSPSATAPRFHPAFWAAFRKPLEGSKRRYVSVGPPVRFQDSSEEDEPDGFLEVPKAYIASPDMDDDRTSQNVEKWIADNDLQRDTYLASAKPKLDSGHPHNLLDRLLLSLDRDDLSRMSMPLDVVLKLRNQAL